MLSIGVTEVASCGLFRFVIRSYLTFPIVLNCAFAVIYTENSEKIEMSMFFGSMPQS